MTFQTWVAELIEERYGTATVLAGMVGMKLSPFTRGVKAGTLKLENLLKLANVTDENPSTVLRLAGKGEQADLIEAVYGTADGAITASEREVLDHWRQLKVPARTAWLSFVRATRDVGLDAVHSDANGNVSAMQTKHTSEPRTRTGATRPRKRRRTDHPRETQSETTALRKRGPSGSSE